ncbi:MAG: sulfatase-like hydrolase/transferase [Armatimonadetes bacterium]|nr:sulfatase-like hydrolase/transferase [Armatimonadota bacterium]
MSRPNIVLVLADDMGYGDFGIFNGGLSQTPNLDRLACEGVCLTQHYAGSCVCAPSRAALMTGRYPHRTGAVDTYEGRGLDRLALAEVTMGDMLQAAGYVTGLLGKWHLGALDPRYHPNQRGFDEFAGFRGGWQDYYDWRLDRNGSISRSDGRYLTDVFTDEACDFVRRHQREPFFLHLTYNAPHFPFQAPDEDLAAVPDAAGLTHAVRMIYAMIRRMDAGVGALLETLEDCGIVNNTIFIFTSDNGPQFGGEGDQCTTRHNCGFNGSKCNVYEGGIRVPGLVRWPDGLPSGLQVDAMMHFCDWLPTLASAVGCDLPAGKTLDGCNVLPMLRGEPGDVCTRRFWQWNRYTPVVQSNAAFRDGDWKLLRPVIRESMAVTPLDGQIDRALKYAPETVTDINREPEPERILPEPPPPMLFNIREDPCELRDLAADEPDRTARMLTELENWFEEVDAERHAIPDEW